MAVMIQKELQVALRKRIQEFEPIARSRAGGITFSLVTSDSLHHVLSPAFLDRFSTSGLRKSDRIQVNADCQGAGERAMLLVEENLEGKVKVRKLWKVERLPGGFKVVDANGQSLAYFYARENDHDAHTAGVLTMDKARRMASNFANLPELLGRG
jgi:hypothetical protein